MNSEELSVWTRVKDALPEVWKKIKSALPESFGFVGIFVMSYGVGMWFGRPAGITCLGFCITALSIYAGRRG